MARRTFLKILFTGFFLLTLISVSYSVQWEYYGNIPQGKFFYDKENIQYMPNDIIRVWIKHIYSDAGKREIVKQLGEHFKDVKESSNLREIDCNKKMFNLLSATDYDSKGSVIKTADVPGDKTLIPPNSVIDMLYKIVCKKNNIEGGSKAVRGHKRKYIVKCEDISGGQCKKECSESDKRIKGIQIAEGEQKGIIADTDCSSLGKDYIFCVEKDKIKK
jgi:hypothetical protein